MFTDQELKEGLKDDILLAVSEELDTSTKSITAAVALNGVTGLPVTQDVLDEMVREGLIRPVGWALTEQGARRIHRVMMGALDAFNGLETHDEDEFVRLVVKES